jgi:hypothetical protein
MEYNEPLAPRESEGNLIRVAVVTSCLVGLAFGLTPFLFLLHRDIETTAIGWPEILLVIMMTGSVALLILMACGAVGFFVGTLLSTFRRSRETGRRAAHPQGI